MYFVYVIILRDQNHHITGCPISRVVTYEIPRYFLSKNYGLILMHICFTKATTHGC